MPALSGRGPFSYDTITLSGTNIYTLVNASYDPTNGETLEVLVAGTKIQGVGLSISGTIISGDGFYVNSLTNPTTISLTPSSSTAEVIIRRISNRATPEVDFAPGSVIRETDLDASTNQTLHVAQEAIDIALQGITFHAGGYWDAQESGANKKISNVLNPTSDQDAATKVYADANVATTLAYKNTTNDYKLESQDWAQKIDAQVKAYSGGSVTGSFIEDSAKNWASGTTSDAPTGGSAKEWAIGGEGTMATTPDGSEFSAKEYAQGSTATGGTSKEWAQTVDVAIDTTFSAKEYAQGDGNSDALTTGGSAKGWSQDTAKVNGATTNDRSSKSWSQGASMTGATLGGSSKDWASTLVTQIDGTLYSAKENATGVTTALGSAKQWALGGGGSFTEGTAVAGGVYSAKKYASDASASETAAANSAAAVSQVYDNFNDVYPGSMRNDKTVADAVTITGASWAKDSSSIAFSGTSSGTVTIGQELTTTATGYPLEANIIGTSTTTPIVISNPFTVAGTGVTLAFAGTGVYGAFNDSTGGPATNNDGDALVNGNLYFNQQQNEMRIWNGSAWIAATAVGQTSLLEYKFVTTSAQVSSRTYSGTADVGGTLSYTQDNILVFMNGVQLKESVVSGATHDYAATNGSSIILAVAPVLNDEIAVIAFKSFTTADMVSASNGGTFSSAVTFGAGLVANTADINAGTFDGIVGGTTPAAGSFTTIGASGAITGNLTGNASGTAATVTTAAQPAITSVGTLTAATVTGLITANGGIETDTNSKVKQKGAFMQSSTHQALTLGY